MYINYKKIFTVVVSIALSIAESAARCSVLPDHLLKRRLLLQKQGSIQLGNLSSETHADLFTSQGCEINRNSDLLEKRSTCPWYLEVDEKANRFPRKIVKAKTECTSCKAYNSPLPATCEPIMEEVAVLYQTDACDSGIYKYEAGVERIPVGYTCTQKYVPSS